MNIVSTILEYFLHASTWKGIIAILTAAGVAISPEQIDKIIPAGMSLIGAIMVFIDDNDVNKSIK